MPSCEWPAGVTNCLILSRRQNTPNLPAFVRWVSWAEGVLLDKLYDYPEYDRLMY